ncbi:MAG TPA: hypothetical protein VE977_13765 [Pyrinomonadaceae bacterium]|nr:hypothetical protein [Pyrinomonadaceae bacterium]
MTKEGEIWALKTAGKKWPEPMIPEQAEYWIRAFCKEYENRIGKKDFYADCYDVYLRLKKEFLG